MCQGSTGPTPVSTGYYSTPENTPTTATGQAQCTIGYFCEGGVRVQCPAGQYQVQERQPKHKERHGHGHRQRHILRHRALTTFRDTHTHTRTNTGSIAANGMQALPNWPVCVCLCLCVSVRVCVHVCACVCSYGDTTGQSNPQCTAFCTPGFWCGSVSVCVCLRVCLYVNLLRVRCRAPVLPRSSTAVPSAYFATAKMYHKRYHRVPIRLPSLRPPRNERDRRCVNRSVYVVWLLRTKTQRDRESERYRERKRKTHAHTRTHTMQGNQCTGGVRVPCSPGSYQNATGTPHIFHARTFESHTYTCTCTGASHCLACPGGRYSTVVGQSSALCEGPCDAGMYACVCACV